MNFMASHVYHRASPVLAAIALYFIAPGTQAQTTTTDFGPAEHFSGVFFSNFENAKFFVCALSDKTCENWNQGEMYTLSCSEDICGILKEKIHEIAKSSDDAVYLRVELTGERSLSRLAPKFLGDPGQTIKVEKIESVTVLSK